MGEAFCDLRGRSRAPGLSEVEFRLVAGFVGGLPIRVVAARAGVDTVQVCDAIRRARQAGVIAPLADRS